ALSQIVLLRELTESYRALTSGREPRLPALEVQYADFAVWQRERLRDEALERQIGYWTERLGSQPPAPELPTDRPRPPVETFAGDRLHLRIEPALTARLETLSRERGTTLYMTMLAIFQTLLHRITGQDDLSTGTPVGGRTRPEVKDLIGMFINNLVLRIDLGGDPPFVELLERVREVALEAFAHQELPFEKLVEVLRPQRDLSRTPLFQVMFVLQTYPAPDEVATPAEVELTTLPIDPGSAIYDLTLNLEEDLTGHFEYSTDLYDAATIRRLAEHLRNLVQGVVAEPARRLSELPLLTAAERRQLAEWNATPELVPALRLDVQVAAWSARRPEAPALVFAEGTWTYRELDRRADRVACHLRRLGVGPEVPVAIAMGRSPERIAALLGVMRAGGAWLPLDPTYPRARLAFMLADARVPVLVTESRLLAGLPEHSAETVLLDGEWPGWNAPDEPPPLPEVGPESLAYLIYTSGSTGEPKGVMVRHGGLSNLEAAHRRPFAMAPGSAMLQFASFSFDASISETITALGCGATLHLAPAEALLPGPELAELLRTRRITHAILPPAVLPALE
ncbi:MAG: AMP-binding protein, partial [bacterium]|nr:AMP-binding protein [bacterium]